MAPTSTAPGALVPAAPTSMEAPALRPATALELCFRHRAVLLLVPVAGALAAILGPGPLEPAALGAGALVAGLGCALRLWAVRAIGKRARVRRPGARELLVVGPYAHVRNPLYVANALVAAGLTATGGSASQALLVLAGCFAVYALVVRREEQVLSTMFGAEYDAYRAAVPRWRWRARSAQDHDAEPVTPWPWRDVLRREVGLIVGIPLALLGAWAVRADLAPLRQLLSPLDPPAVAAGALAIAGFVNLVSTELQLRMHARRRV